jgi:hypothetical protein
MNRALVIVATILRFQMAQHIYRFLPQHFLNLRPLPQIQGSLRPVFGASRIIGVWGGQQLVLVHPDPLSLVIAVSERLLLSFISSQHFYTVQVWLTNLVSQLITL